MPPADGTAPVQVAPLSHFLALERQADDTREAISRRELERSSGVSWSGMGSEPFTRRSEAQLRRDAIERRQALIDYQDGWVVSSFRRF